MTDATVTTARLDAPATAKHAYARALATVGLALAVVVVGGCMIKAWEWSMLIPAVLGLALAAVAVGGGVVFHDRALSAHRFDADSRLASQRLQAMLGASFLCKLVALAIGFGCIAWMGVKFPGQVAFGLAFAVAALSLQLGTALRLTARVGGPVHSASPHNR